MTVLDQFRLNGRRALVTGGGRGLGRVIAQALAEAGADVAVAGRTPDVCQEAAREIAAATGRRALAFAADVTQAAEVERLVREVEDGLGRHRHPRQQRGRQHPRGGRGAPGERLGLRPRHQPEGAVPLRPGGGRLHVRARLGARDQPRLDPVGDRPARGAPPTRRPRPGCWA